MLKGHLLGGARWSVRSMDAALRCHTKSSLRHDA
jgi:hypothetical protein